MLHWTMRDLHQLNVSFSERLSGHRAWSPLVRNSASRSARRARTFAIFTRRHRHTLSARSSFGAWSTQTAAFRTSSVRQLDLREALEAASMIVGALTMVTLRAS